MDLKSLASGRKTGFSKTARKVGLSVTSYHPRQQGKLNGQGPEVSEFTSFPTRHDRPGGGTSHGKGEAPGDLGVNADPSP
jgi:hypothetical protein